ncbi:peptidase M17 [Telmatocola sphagniphila]|uniref:Peptidase M17 n=1 Tax=Telmatocola sphagniphila TaxID=1123043 RepID=A0A8E6EUQ2_9BACT|nr:M17 family peptidase N-terminal domain-containing protein [Telmatocola sphagniphila]QVL31690.1 peptidase M17 [Telmatocola sphagniphila]
MNQSIKLLALAFFQLVVAIPSASAENPVQAPAETKLAGPHDSSIIVRMQGPYDAEVPLQIVCYFKKSAESDKKMTGAPVELDKRLGGLISSLRNRGEFTGDDLEVLIIDAPAETIKPKKLLLIGLGDEANLSLQKMTQIGISGLREAAKLGATKVAFAPLIRDQGNNRLKTGDVESAVIRGMLMAYDTERRLQKQGFAKSYALQNWVVEAGPAYYEETISGVKKGIAEAGTAIQARDVQPYSTKSK